jgi:CRISPR-associated protein Cas2
MSEQHWHLLAYDVREPHRLRRVAKVLEGYGERLQYSVFRCKLSPKKLERLRIELNRELASDDALLVVPLCSGCAARLQFRGKAFEWPPEPPSFVVV